MQSSLLDCAFYKTAAGLRVKILTVTLTVNLMRLGHHCNQTALHAFKLILLW